MLSHVYAWFLKPHRKFVKQFLLFVCLNFVVISLSVPCPRPSVVKGNSHTRFSPMCWTLLKMWHSDVKIVLGVVPSIVVPHPLDLSSCKCSVLRFLSLLHPKCMCAYMSGNQSWILLGLRVPPFTPFPQFGFLFECYMLSVSMPP